METSTQTQSDFRLWLQAELMKRVKKNPQYSLRSFAALLEMDSSSVSQLISGKRRGSKKVITKICEKLEAESGLVKRFLAKTVIKPESGVQVTANYQLLNDDIIEVLSTWYYFAILEVMNTVDFQSSYTWIASKLSVSVSEVKIAIERLIRLKLLVIENGQFKRTSEQLTTYSPGATSAARRAFQKQVLSMAINAIDEVPIERRDMSNMTMAIDVDKIPEARRMITKFRRELCEFLEPGKEKQYSN